MFEKIAIKNEDPPACDMCGCSVCDWKGKISDCGSHEDSEGWEYPSYIVHECPVCEDGGDITDYWPSKEKLNAA